MNNKKDKLVTTGDFKFKEGTFTVSYQRGVGEKPKQIAIRNADQRGARIEVVKALETGVFAVNFNGLKASEILEVFDAIETEIASIETSLNEEV